MKCINCKFYTDEEIKCKYHDAEIGRTRTYNDFIYDMITQEIIGCSNQFAMYVNYRFQIADKLIHISEIFKDWKNKNI